MFSLLAQAAAAPAPAPTAELTWTTGLLAYGPLGIIFALICALIWRFAPKWFENKLKFDQAVIDQGNRHAEAGERFAASIEQIGGVLTKMSDPRGSKDLGDHPFANTRTNRALLAMAEAFETWVDSLEGPAKERMRVHVGAIKKALLTSVTDA